MSTRVRPWVVLIAVGVIVLSVFAAVSRRSGKATLGKPEDTSMAQAPASQTGGAVGDVPGGASSAGKSEGREPVRIAVPRKGKVILRDGRIVPAKEGRASLSDPGVMAVVYEGAPPAAVQRLKEILESGSNEYPDFTKSEKYPPWVYDKIREMLPGKLGEIIARMAREWSDVPPEQKVGPPALDYSNVEETGYSSMYLASDVVTRWASTGRFPPSVIPVADTKFGIVVVNNPQSGWLAEPAPADLAEWLAHRLAAGDNRVKLPRIPPRTYGDDWESWVRGSIEENVARQFEDAGLLTKHQTK